MGYWLSCYLATNTLYVVRKRFKKISSFSQNRIPITYGCFVQSLIEIGSKEVGNLKSLQTTDWWTLEKRWYEKFTSAFMHMCAERILWLEIQEGPHVGFSFLPCYTLFRWSKYFHLQCLYILFHYQCIFKTVKLMHHIYFSIIYKFINKWYFFKKIVFLLCAQIALILILNTVKW